MCENYNGWSNRWTWVVNFWLDNEPGTSESLYEVANDPDCSLRDKTEQLKDYVEDMVNGETGYLGKASMSSDLIGSALAWVDFQEIIEAHIEDGEDAE